MKKILFVIDTDKYSGNFEREMCAYLTGTLGECEVGRPEQSEFEDDVENQNIIDEIDGIIMMVDEEGCSRPCSTYPTENRTSHNSVVIYFDEVPSKELIDLMKIRATKFTAYSEAYNDINILGFRLYQEKTVLETIPITE